MWTSLFLCCVLAVTVGHAQRPGHCFSPPQLNFKSFQFNHDLNDFRRYLGEYDAREQRIAFFDDDDRRGNKTFHWGIGLFREKTFYEIELKQKTCKKYPFKHFYHFGVPEKAKYVDSYEVGGPNESLEVEEWFEPHAIGGREWVGIFSKAKCIPVSTYLFKNHKNQSETTRYYDVMEGIPRPEWFIPPTYCK